MRTYYELRPPRREEKHDDIREVWSRPREEEERRRNERRRRRNALSKARTEPQEGWEQAHT